MSREVSSFYFEEESEPSILAMPPKTQLEITNEALLRQISELRSDIRELKHENKWLKDYKQGSIQELETLKQLYRSNKQSLCSMNADFRIANEQINRLEDQLNYKQIQIEQLQDQLRQLQNDHERSGIEKNQLKIALTEQRMKAQYLERQLEELKADKLLENTQQMNTFNDKLMEIFTKLERHPLSSPPKSHRSSQAISPQKESAYQLIEKLECLLEQQKQNHEYYKQQTKKMEQKFAILQKKHEIVEIQLKQASQLLELSREDHKIIIEKTNRYENDYNNSLKQIHKQKEIYKKHYNQIINKLEQVCAIYIPSEVSLLRQLIGIANTSPNQFKAKNYQFQILLREIKSVVYEQFTKIMNNESQSQLNKRLQKKLNSISEQFQILKIKHSTLQREYDAITQDNRRILKYNNLSRYRTERNFKLSDNKENKGNCTNICSPTIESRKSYR